MEKKNRGLIFTILGIIFTSLAMFLLYMEKPTWMFLSSSILGVLLAFLGVIKILYDNKRQTK